MIFELLFNAALLLVCVICFVNITMVAPEPIQGNMNAAQWPQIIFGLLIVTILINMVKVYMNTPKEERNIEPLKAIKLQNILKSKITWAFVLIFGMIPMLNTIGFIFSGLIFSAGFVFLFGERKPLNIVLASVLITAVLYVLFINLNIMLPRGVGIFRTITLAAETFVRF